MFKRLIISTASVLAIAGAGGAVALASSAEPAGSGAAVASATPLPTPFDETVSTSPVAAVEPAATAALPALKALPATAMPAAVAAQIGSPTRFGRNPNLARAIATVTGQGWVIPGRGYVCLAVPDGAYGWASVCTTTADAAANGIQATLGGNDPAGRVAVTTVPPSGKSVVAKTAAGVASLTGKTPGVSSIASTGDVTSAFVTPDLAIAVAAK